MRSEDEPYEIEVLEGEVVACPAGELESADVELESADVERLHPWPAAPAVQAAVAAATGFVAGAATVALMRRYAQSRLEREPTRQLPASGRVRTYVVQVRQLG